MSEESDHTTQLLERWSSGDRAAMQELISHVYGELRAVAARYRRSEGRASTLQTTELLHEAFIRLAGAEKIWWKNRAQFFTVAAHAVRNILVDQARRRNRLKRGGGSEPASLDAGLPIPSPPGVDLQLLDTALVKLEAMDPVKAQIVNLRFFGGLSIEEIAEILDLGSATVKRHWSVARLWLFREIQGEMPE